MVECSRGRNPQGQRTGSSRQAAPSGRPKSSGPRHGGGGEGAGSGGTQAAVVGRGALPWYVGDHFNDAPPGHRYLMYLPFWKIEQNWSAIKEGKQQAIKSLCVIPPHACGVMSELAKRQRDIGKSIGAEVIEAVGIAPFATGLGWEHPNENGFAFLHPYGLPYLAGSGIKGVLRDAAQELAKGLAGDMYGWTEDAITALFGPRPEEIEKAEDTSRGALRFFDVIPEIAGNSMSVDIMNPHYNEYYQNQGNGTPHDAGSPVPIFFLVVPPKSTFTFVVDCPREHLLPDELKGKWRQLTLRAFEHAFDWLGFGAKTAVGYGAMKRDEAREEEYRKEREERARQAADAAKAKRKEEEHQAKLAALDPLDREIEELLTGRPDKNQTEESCLINAVKQGRWSGDAKRRVAEKLRNMMQQGKRWKETSQAKKPDKDRDYQNTLLVVSWLSGES